MIKKKMKTPNFRLRIARAIKAFRSDVPEMPVVLMTGKTLDPGLCYGVQCLFEEFAMSGAPMPRDRFTATVTIEGDMRRMEADPDAYFTTGITFHWDYR
jgi:hypothetical protein